MVGVDEIVAVKAQVIRLARTVEPEVLALGDAKAALHAASAMKNAASVLEMQLAKRVADAGDWRREGHRSPAEQLAASTGTSTGNAKERLETAERLGSQPDLERAAQEGELSAEQTTMISDAVGANPDAERDLIETAKKGSLNELGEACDRAKAAADPDPDATHARNRRQRCLRFWSKAGVAKLFGQTTPEQMASIKAAVEHRAEQLFQRARRAGAPQPRETYLMDALEQICLEWLGQPVPGTQDDDDCDHGDPGSSPPPGGGGGPTPPASTGPTAGAKCSAKAPPFLGLVRLDHAALVRGHTEGDEVCEIVGLGPVPVRVAVELLGDAVLHLILTKGNDVATTVNIKRGPNVAQRMALLWKSPLCEVDCCTVPRVEIDHDIPWAKTKHTLLAELQRLCKHHHYLKTVLGWAVIRKDGNVWMVPPDDPLHPGL